MFALLALFKQVLIRNDVPACDRPVLNVVALRTRLCNLASQDVRDDVARVITLQNCHPYTRHHARLQGRVALLSDSIGRYLWGTPTVGIPKCRKVCVHTTLGEISDYGLLLDVLLPIGHRARAAAPWMCTGMYRNQESLS